VHSAQYRCTHDIALYKFSTTIYLSLGPSASALTTIRHRASISNYCFTVNSATTFDKVICTLLFLETLNYNMHKHNRRIVVVNCAGLIQLYSKSGQAVTVSPSDEVALSAGIQGATTFMLVGCRTMSTVSDNTRPSSVSLMDTNRADWYIRHSSYYLQVESENLTDDLPLFQGDSSYILHVDTFYTGYYALESVSLPDHYIKSDVNGRLMVTRRSDTAAYNDTASFGT